MTQPNSRCARCAEGTAARFGVPTTMAFQPIVSLSSRTIFAHEALVRGSDGEGAGEILGAVDEENQYSFDQDCRVTAIRIASELGVTQSLSINFMPNAVYNPENCLRRTIWAADKYDLPPERIIFELTEEERVVDIAHLRNIIDTYRREGLRTAIDDFGAGYSGLNLLSELQPDYLKIDRALLSHIDTDSRRQAIVRGIVNISGDLGIGVIAEGLERAEEVGYLADIGIDLMQGFFSGNRFSKV